MDLAVQRRKIGNKIRELREKAGWNQSRLGLELAGALGKSQAVAGATISRYEEGKRSVRSEMLEALAGVFGVASSFFYESGAQVSEIRTAYEASSNTKKLAVIEEIPLSFPDCGEKDISGYAEFPRFMYPGAGFIVKIGDSFSLESDINEGDYIIVATSFSEKDKDNLLYKLEGIFFIGKPPKKPLQAETLGLVLGVIKKL